MAHLLIKLNDVNLLVQFIPLLLRWNQIVGVMIYQTVMLEREGKTTMTFMTYNHLQHHHLMRLGVTAIQHNGCECFMHLGK